MLESSARTVRRDLYKYYSNTLSIDNNHFILYSGDYFLSAPFLEDAIENVYGFFSRGCIQQVCITM